jgi:hypothetical protein
MIIDAPRWFKRIYSLFFNIPEPKPQIDFSAFNALLRPGLRKSFYLGYRQPL